MTMGRQAKTASGLAYTLTGTGPALVLVHGLMARGAMFDPLVELLAPDFQLLVPDLRGHGASAGLAGPFSIERSANDILELLDHVGLSSASLLGYSHGGPVCQWLTHEHPARVQRLVLACTYAINAATAREYFESWVFGLLVTALGAPRLARVMIRQGASVGGGPPLSAPQVAWLHDVLGSATRQAVIAGTREMRRFDSRPWLSSITTPTLLIAGAEDHAVPEHHQRMLTHALPHCQRRIVAGAGHTLAWTHTAELAQLVRDWLTAR